MPMKLSVGLSQKRGLPDYGSVGATCHVEVEIDGSLLQNDMATFHRHVRNAYVACSQAVNDELTRQCVGQTDEHQVSSRRSTNGDNQVAGPTDNGNGAHRPSQKQLDYVNQLARQIRGLGVRRMETLCDRMFDKPLADLSSFEASALIDQLKALKSGDIDLADVLGEEAAT